MRTLFLAVLLCAAGFSFVPTANAHTSDTCAAFAGAPCTIPCGVGHVLRIDVGWSGVVQGTLTCGVLTVSCVGRGECAASSRELVVVPGTAVCEAVGATTVTHCTSVHNEESPLSSECFIRETYGACSFFCLPGDVIHVEGYDEGWRFPAVHAICDGQQVRCQSFQSCQATGTRVERASAGTCHVHTEIVVARCWVERAL